MVDQEQIQRRLRENRARIDWFPDKKKEEKLPFRLIDIAKALDVPEPSRPALIEALQKKKIKRVLDVGVGSGTDTLLGDLARLSINGKWLFPSENLVGIDNNVSPLTSQSAGIFTFESADALDYKTMEPFDIVYAKGVLSSGWDHDVSMKWANTGEVPHVFIALKRLLNLQNPNALIVLEPYIWGEWILITEEQASEQGSTVVKGASTLFSDERIHARRGIGGKMYSKIVLRRDFIVELSV